MTLRAGMLSGLAILGMVLFGVWLFAPSAFAEAGNLLDGEALGALVARAGYWGPVLIVTLMTVAVVADGCGLGVRATISSPEQHG